MTIILILMVLGMMCMGIVRGQDITLVPVTNIVTNVTYIVKTNSYMPPLLNHVKPMRRWHKTCPECGAVCESTNLLWNGGHTDPSGAMIRDGVVTFACNGEKFSEVFHELVTISTPIGRRMIRPSLP